MQDLGRWGHQASGVPVAGPMDPYAHRLANRLVGNAESAAALEATLIGPEIAFESPAIFALTGADLSPRLDGLPQPTNTVCEAPAGSVLSFGGRRRGAGRISRLPVACRCRRSSGAARPISSARWAGCRGARCAQGIGWKRVPPRAPRRAWDGACRRSFRHRKAER